MSVSGGAQKGSLIVGELHGKALLTGGAVGPEASIVAVVVCLTAAIYLLWKATHRPTSEVSRPYRFASGKAT
jgi:uncharacterized protein